MFKYVDLTGQRFGNWVVLYGPTQSNGERTKWHCRCDCGIEKDVLATNLTRGLTTSCGCNLRRVAREKATTHGKRNTRLYVVWCNMRHRCYNENDSHYKYYGGRGISVCNEWLGKDGFQNFWDWAYSHGYDDSAPRGQCTIDRIDVNGPYSPDNCRWITIVAQSRNRTDNKVLTLDGKTQTLVEWCEEYGISRFLVSERLNRGWELRRALNEPPKQMWENVEYNGEIHSYSEWARILGIKKKTIQYRVQHGWTLEEIMSPLGTVNHQRWKGIKK